MDNEKKLVSIETKIQLRKVKFEILVESLLPQVDDIRAGLLRQFFSDMKKNKMTEKQFLSLIQVIVGPQMLMDAIAKMQVQNLIPLGPLIPEEHKGNEALLETSECKISWKQSSEFLPLGNNSGLPTKSVPAELDPALLFSSSALSVGMGMEGKAQPEKSACQKKPIEESATPSHLSRKRIKTSGTFPDQGFELADVVALGGVDEMEKKEQLLSAHRKGSEALKALRRNEQDIKEERLILQKAPLQEKLAKIISKCGIKRIAEDVDLCLSLCVEKRMHDLIQSVITASKQRVDSEKSSHQTVVTSDIKCLVADMNHKLEEDWKKKQVEVKEHCNEVKVSLEDQDKKQVVVQEHCNEEKEINMTNAAARVALGGDDMILKWQQPQWQRDRESSSPSIAQPSKDVSSTSLQTLQRTVRGGQQLEENDHKDSADEHMQQEESSEKPQTNVVRSLSMKDVISVLERDPQMSKSTFVHRLYEKMYHK